MTEKSMRVRFAPSPTGNVHIGNIRVAIFNWLFAKHSGGQFILRIEDTDLERSTAEAIAKMQAAMKWLGLDHDEEPLYQTSRRSAHDDAVKKMLADRAAYQRDEKSPVVLRISAPLFSDDFVSAPKEAATIDFSVGQLTANRHALFLKVTSARSGETFVTPTNWDALTDSRLQLDNGTEISGEELREKLPENDAVALPIGDAKITSIKFQRRYVFFDDLVLGKCEKPLDSIRDFTIARADGSPVFHLANVADDIFQNITHILRGNDHVENTFRHLFLFRALAAKPPRYGHFPMIVNQSGKPYSKRDGDAYVGDFQAKGFLADAMFNYLALCGWASGDDREILSRTELVELFTLDRVSKAAAQFDLKKLAWMNQQYIQKMPSDKFILALKNAAGENGIDVKNYSENWWEILANTQRDRLEKFGDFFARCRYFFADDFSFDPKAVKKHWLANNRAGGEVLHNLRDLFSALTDAEWTVENLDNATHRYAEKITPTGEAPALGAVAQPLRVAISGTAATPGIGETLFLVGRERSLSRLDRAIRESENFSA